MLAGLGSTMYAQRYPELVSRQTNVRQVLLVCGWLGLVWFTALGIVNSEVYLTSRHMWDIPMSSYENIALVTWIAELAFLICSCFTKVSVLMFYRRLVDHTVSKYWIWTVICAISFTISYSLAFILVLIFNCSPTEAYWKAFNPSWTAQYTCVDTTIVNLLAGIMSIISDLYSVILPCLMTRHLLLPKAQKLGLFFVFSLGLLAVVASSVRTYWLVRVITTPVLLNRSAPLTECSTKLGTPAMCQPAYSTYSSGRNSSSVLESCVQHCHHCASSSENTLAALLRDLDLGALSLPVEAAECLTKSGSFKDKALQESPARISKTNKFTTVPNIHRHLQHRPALMTLS